MSKMTCQICGLRKASRAGEHVWPKWFLKLMDTTGTPPHRWALNGITLENSEGKPIQLQQQTRVLLPVCQECNNALNDRFEQPAFDAISQLSTNRWKGQLSSSEWRNVGMWWAKVGLMLGHEAARYDHKVLNERALRFSNKAPDYTWMVNNTPAPSDLSVFIHHTSMEPGDTESVLDLPRHIERSDGSTGLSHLYQILIPDICISVVSHPGMTIKHPLVERGDAWELLRGAPEGGDLGALPQFGHRVVVFRQGLLAYEGFQIDASEASQLIPFSAHEPQQVPDVYPGPGPVSRLAYLRQRHVSSSLGRWLNQILVRK